MKPKNSRLKLAIILTSILALIVPLVVYLGNSGSGNTALAEARQQLALTPPGILENTPSIAALLDQEAGMSIWLNATQWAPLSLESAKNGMVNIEINTSDYVIGSISREILGFPSDDWPHCFVHKTGWIVVYYLKINNVNLGTTGWVGKIFPMFKDSHVNWYDSSSHSLNDNLLHNALATICDQIPEIPGITGAQYYHFQYPSAKTLEIAVKTSPYGEVTFNINVPSTLIIDERSWSYCSLYGGYFKIDTTTIFSGAGKNYQDRAYGGPEITASVLSPDVWHKVTIRAYSGEYPTTACIVIIYH
jgi:hypothetical protein